MNKIDFAIIITATKCNPNGDPLNNNIPRHDINGYGEISNVCIKRKIRDRLYESGENILIMILGGIIKLVLNIVLIRNPQIGICGAAISTTVSNMLICLLSVISIYRLTNTKCRFMETYFKPLHAGILCGISALLTYVFLSAQTFFTLNFRIVLILSVAVGSIMYFFTLYLLCETPKNMINYIFSKKNQKST